MNKACFILIVAFFLIVILIIIISNVLQRSLGKPKLVARGQIVSSAIDQEEENIYFYESSENKIKKIHLKNLAVEELLSPNIGQINNLFWSPDASKIIAITVSGEKETAYLIELENENIKLIGPNIRTVTWQNDSQKILYHFYDFDTGTSVLNRSNPDGSAKETLTTLKDFPEYNLSVSEDNQKIIYYTPPSDIGGTNLYLYDIGLTKTRILIDDYSLAGAKFIQNQIVYEQIRSDPTLGNEIFIMPSVDETSIKLGIQTSINKIASNLTNNSLIAAIPQNEKSDNIDKINLDDQSVERVLDSDSKNNYQIFAPDIAAKRSILSFVNNEGLFLMKFK